MHVCSPFITINDKHGGIPTNIGSLRSIQKTWISTVLYIWHPTVVLNTCGELHKIGYMCDRGLEKEWHISGS